MTTHRQFQRLSGLRRLFALAAILGFHHLCAQPRHFNAGDAQIADETQDHDWLAYKIQFPINRPQMAGFRALHLWPF